MASGFGIPVVEEIVQGEKKDEVWNVVSVSDERFPVDAPHPINNF